MGAVAAEMPSVDYEARIAKLNSRKEKYKQLIEKTSLLKADINSTSDYVRDTSNEMREMIVNGEPIDKGALSNASNSLNNMAEVFDDVIRVCKRKIADIDDSIERLRWLMDKSLRFGTNNGRELK